MKYEYPSRQQLIELDEELQKRRHEPTSKVHSSSFYVHYLDWDEAGHKRASAPGLMIGADMGELKESKRSELIVFDDIEDKPVSAEKVKEVAEKLDVPTTSFINKVNAERAENPTKLSPEILTEMIKRQVGSAPVRVFVVDEAIECGVNIGNSGELTPASITPIGMLKLKEDVTFRNIADGDSKIENIYSIMSSAFRTSLVFLGVYTEIDVIRDVSGIGAVIEDVKILTGFNTPLTVNIKITLNKGCYIKVNPVYYDWVKIKTEKKNIEKVKKAKVNLRISL